MRTVLRVDGMHCGHCCKTVEDALRAVPGVEKAEVSLENGKAVVTHGSDVPLGSLLEAVQACGYVAAVT